MLDIILLTVAGVGIIVGSITDIQKREVADWVNFSLLFAGIGIRLLYSAQTGQWQYLAAGIIGAAVMFGIGALMYYTGQWGGGDAKMLMGTGALLATYEPIFLVPFFGDSVIFNNLTANWFTPQTTILFSLIFFVNTMIAGAIYGLIWSSVATIRKFDHVKAAWKELPKGYGNNLAITMYIVAAMLVMTAVTFMLQSETRFAITALALAALSLLFRHAKRAAKAVEDGTMRHLMAPSDITEGEWILEDVTVGGKVIAKAKHKLTEQDIKSIKCAPPKLLAIKTAARSSKVIPIHDFEDTMKLAKDVTINREKINYKKVSKQDLFTLMHEKIKEKSKLVKVIRNKQEKLVHQSKLKVGDMLQEDLYKNRLTIITKNNLGIDRYQIVLIQKHIQDPVQVKIGIPFIPAFLLGLLVTLIWGAPYLRVLF